MKQIQLTTFGQPSVVTKCIEVAELTPPSPWEVMVDIEAFPINAADLAMISGRYGILPKPPATIGMEAVGTISAVGKSVAHLTIGDRVVLLANNNWAERRKVPATAVHKVPLDLPALQLAMLKVNPATAYLLLSQLQSLSAGDWILQTAPLGSVGECVIQLAKSRGIRTLNVVRNPDAKRAVLMLGGDAAIDAGPDMPTRVRQAIGREVVTLAFDAVGGGGIADLAESLSDNGAIVNYGMLSGEPCVLPSEQAIFRGVTLRGFWLSKVLNRLTYEERTTMYDALCGMIQNQTLQLSVDSCFHIDEIKSALQRAERPGRNGKVIVTCRNGQ